MSTTSLVSPALNKAAATSTSIDIQAMKTNALNVGGAAPGTARGMQFVKFNGNTGALVYGRANSPIMSDQKLIIAMPSLLQGWVYWDGGRPEKDTDVMVSAFHTYPDKPDDRALAGTMPKPHERDGWQQTYAFNMFGLDGVLDTFELNFQHSSTAFQRLWGDIAMAIVAQDEAEPGTPFHHPVVTLDVDSYEHPTYSRTVYTIEHTVVGWSDGVTVMEPDSSKPDEGDEDDDILG